MNGPAISSAQLHSPSNWLSGAHIAIVQQVNDPESQGRVQVQMLSADPDGEAPIWARVATSFAGDQYGLHALPDVGEEVLVLFAGNDSAHPIVVGALWNGATQVPDEFAGDRVDRWSINGKAGTRIAIVEESSGQEKVEILTPGGVSATVTDDSGGSITMTNGSSTITVDTQGITIDSAAKVSVTASANVEVSAAMVKVEAGMSQFSGVVKCDTLIATSVVGTTYTPGAGNIW